MNQSDWLPTSFLAVANTTWVRDWLFRIPATKTGIRLHSPDRNGKPANGLGRRAHLTFRGNVALGRHGWLRLTPAYSLALVRELLKQSGPDEFVLVS